MNDDAKALGADTFFYASEAQRITDSERAARTRVLVIDDSEIARVHMQNLLEAGGFRVLTLPSAIGASRLIQREGVSVVVIDISMPGLSGDRLVEVLRKNARMRNLIIMVVSGCSLDELEQIRMRCGADEAIAKRELSEALVAAITRHLCRASTERLKAEPKP